MDVHLVRRIRHASNLEIVEVALLDAAADRRDLSQTCQADRHDGGTFHLRPDAIRIDDHTGVDDLLDARHLHSALPIDFDLDDRRYIGVEAAVRGNPHAPAVTRLARAPARLLSGDLEHLAEPSRVDWVLVVRRAVVRVI